jgi:hypothetical protein
MMRARTIVGTAITAFSLAVAVTVLVVGGIQRPEPVVPDDRVPDDLFWPWMLSCSVGTSLPLLNVSYDADGLVDVDVGALDPDAPYGTPLADENGDYVVNERASLAVEECLSAHRFDVSSGSYREATEAERLLLYDWTVRWQAPCLEARDLGAPIPSFEDFLDPHQAPWHLISNRDWFSEEFDFDAALAARHACEPLPPFLAADGVGW